MTRSAAPRRHPIAVAFAAATVLALVVAVPAIALNVLGGSGPDVLRGSAQSDWINGKGGNDRLFGLGGNDILTGGPGADYASGGAGNDRLLLRDKARDRAVCGEGRDTVIGDEVDRVGSDCEVVRLIGAPEPSPPPAPAPPPTPAPPPVAPVTPGAYRGQTQNGNFVFFTVTANRTITGFRINDLPAPCDGPLRLIGGRDWGSAVWPVAADGSFLATGSWSGSDIQGDAEWTSWDARITGRFNNATTVTGTVIENSELNLNGRHWRCSTGEIRWSAALG